jgi:hypothetical protein
LYISEQSGPQLMPVGLLVTVPLPVPVLETIRGVGVGVPVLVGVPVAVFVGLAVAVTLTGRLPLPGVPLMTFPAAFLALGP